MARISDFRQKEVVDIGTGKRLGYITDMEIDEEEGRLLSVTVPSGKLFSSLVKNRDTVIPWDHIRKIGGDIILVELL